MRNAVQLRYVAPMLELGLTGGIGSGKSTVAQKLVDKGAKLIDADQIVRDLQAPGAPVFVAMVERWGAKIVGDDGNLNRAAVADIVFGDTDELDALNGIVHPSVVTKIADLMKEFADADAASGSNTVVINDIPLLVNKDGKSERPEYDRFKGIIVVDVPVEVAVARLVEFRGFEKSDAEARIASQASREQRKAVADFVVDNSGTMDDLDPQIDTCWEWIETLRKGTSEGAG